MLLRFLFLLLVSTNAWPHEGQQLKALKQRALAAASRGATPVVVFDIDDTLVDTRARTAAILREAGVGAEPHQMAFHIEESLVALGIADGQQATRLKKLWQRSFFSAETLVHDTALPGAARYLHWLAAVPQLKIVYLSGRLDPEVGAATRESLAKLGFPVRGHQTVFFLKPSSTTEDAAFKKAAAEQIRSLGEVIGVFENEPRNLNLLHEAFPKARAFFVETIHSRRPDRPFAEALSIRNFRPAGLEPEVLPRTLQLVRGHKARGSQPVVLFDLDETLINSRSRAIRILKDLSKEWSASRYRVERGIIEAAARDDQDGRLSLTLKSYPLYSEEILRELGVKNKDLAASVHKKYVSLYLSNEYCATDPEIPGAASFVRSLHRAGAHVVYITGRNWPNMGECTKESLRRLGLPAEQRATLLMKPRADIDDTEFKVKALREIASLGTVVAGFENEPANLNAFRAAFPLGLYGFVESAHSHRPDRVGKNVSWIRTFR